MNRKDFSQLTTPKSQSALLTNAYIQLKISIMDDITRQIELEFNYSKEDFLFVLKSRISSNIYQLLEKDLHCYLLDDKGVLVELPHVQNLPNGTSIFLYNDNFCDEELLELLKNAKCNGLSPVFAYAGVRKVKSLRSKIGDEAFMQNLAKLVGRDFEEIIWSLEDILNDKK